MDASALRSMSYLIWANMHVLIFLVLHSFKMKVSNVVSLDLDFSNQTTQKTQKKGQK